MNKLYYINRIIKARNNATSKLADAELLLIGFISTYFDCSHEDASKYVIDNRMKRFLDSSEVIAELKELGHPLREDLYAKLEKELGVNITHKQEE